MSNTQRAILGVLQRDAARSRATGAMRTILIFMFALAIIINVANIYQSRRTLIEFMSNSAEVCLTTQNVSGMGLAIALEYPIFKYFYANNSTPQFISDIVMSFGPQKKVNLTMICGDNLPKGQTPLSMAKNWGQPHQQNAFAAIVPATAKIVTDAVSTTAADINPLTKLLNGGFLALANEKTDMSPDDLWKYCFVAIHQTKHTKPPCHPDVAGFATGVASQATSVAFLGGMAAGAEGGPAGMIIGGLIGAAFGVFTNQKKLC